MPGLLDRLTAAYRVQAAPDPQVVARLLNLFSQLDLTPSLVKARLEGEWMWVVVHQPGLSEDRAELIAEKMRSMVMVEQVGLECHLPALARAA
jgi:hypothetical protein